MSFLRLRTTMDIAIKWKVRIIEFRVLCKNSNYHGCGKFYRREPEPDNDRFFLGIFL